MGPFTERLDIKVVCDMKGELEKALLVVSDISVEP